MSEDSAAKHGRRKLLSECSATNVLPDLGLWFLVVVPATLIAAVVVAMVSEEPKMSQRPVLEMAPPPG